MQWVFFFSLEECNIGEHDGDFCYYRVLSSAFPFKIHSSPLSMADIFFGNENAKSTNDYISLYLYLKQKKTIYWNFLN